ncbi:hypothetical protein CPB84DRAFT_694458 [Gymnopilus junonius]|uniref:Uncharacterized protein n=1 Tax=Gymnopilus junonius TaxID=109634 RepID=A0A9P5NSZ4_GYMJU|nr:hypothetical protein CPB84DRAFT_694458 [Gymnopilus junonius]
MKFISTTFVFSAALVSFGVSPGVNPTGTGDCDGVPNAQGVAIKIPCTCPPDRDLFIADLNANVAAGHAVNNTVVSVSFPTDNSPASQLARLHAATVTLQNLRGPGVGCPSAATTFNAQAQAIQDGTAPSPAAPPAAAAPPPPPPASSPAAAAPASGGVDPALVPQFGVSPGQNPTGTGDCDGIDNAQGVAIKIPCACPPDRNTFIQSLSANVAAGHAVHNPTVQLSFPTDGSKTSQLARIEASIITLQNLNGPGQGCPAASTTFVAQQQAIQNSP